MEGLRLISRLKLFLKRGREWVILLLSLFLASFIWLVHNLSRDYSYFLSFNVKAVSNIDGRAPEAISTEVLILRGKASGFYILGNKLGFNNLLEASVDHSLWLRSAEDKDVFSVTTENIKSSLIAKLDNQVNVEFISTYKLDFLFEEVSVRKLPIELKSSFSFDSQYMRSKPVRMKPDSVLVYGSPEIISNLKSVYTEMLSLDDLRNDQEGVVSLIAPRATTLGVDQTYYSLDVDRYIEKVINVPIFIKNSPANKQIVTVPSSIDVSYRHSYYSQREYDAEDFVYYIDYLEFVDAISPKLIPRLESTPQGIYSVQIKPEFVDCALFQVLEP